MRRNIQKLAEFVKGAKVMALTKEDEFWHEAIVLKVEPTSVKIKYLDEKKDGNEDFTLELLEKKFQGKNVFMGGGEVTVELGDIMTPAETRDYLGIRKDGTHIDEAQVEETKENKMYNNIYNILHITVPKMYIVLCYCCFATKYYII